jgi:hypothetical protein
VEHESISQTLARVADAQAALLRARRLGALPEGWFEKVNGLLLSAQQTLCAVCDPTRREVIAAGEPDRRQRRSAEVEVEPSVVVANNAAT